MLTRALLIVTLALSSQVMGVDVCPTYSPIITTFQVGREIQVWYKTQREYNGVCLQYEPTSFVVNSKNPGEIAFRMIAKESTFFVAPLTCSAVGKNSVTITFKSKDNCHKALVNETFEFDVVSDEYPCFGGHIPPTIEFYRDWTAEQVYQLPQIVNRHMFEGIQLLNKPKWLRLN